MFTFSDKINYWESAILVAETISLTCTHQFFQRRKWKNSKRASTRHLEGFLRWQRRIEDESFPSPFWKIRPHLNEFLLKQVLRRTKQFAHRQAYFIHAVFLRDSNTQHFAKLQADHKLRMFETAIHKSRVGWSTYWVIWGLCIWWPI